MEARLRCRTAPYKQEPFEFRMDATTASLTCLAAGVHVQMPIAEFMQRVQWLVSMGLTQRCLIQIEDTQLDFSMPKGVAFEIMRWADASAVRANPKALPTLQAKCRQKLRLGTVMTVTGLGLTAISFFLWQYATARWQHFGELMFKGEFAWILFGPLAFGTLTLLYAFSLRRRLKWLTNKL